MTGLERTLQAVVFFLEERKIPYMVIGGIANLVWGVPRSTVDVDMTVWVGGKEEKAFIEETSRRFASLVPDPVEFAADTRVLPIQAEGFRVDVILGGLPYEERAIRRAKAVPLGGQLVKVCSPEDLIVLKIISERERDREDVRGIVRASGSRLDRAYLDPIVEALAGDLARPEILEFYRSELGKIVK